MFGIDGEKFTLYFFYFTDMDLEIMKRGGLAGFQAIVF